MWLEAAAETSKLSISESRRREREIYERREQKIKEDQLNEQRKKIKNKTLIPFLDEEYINKLTKKDIRNLKKWQIQYFTLKQISWFKEEQIRSFSKDQLEYLLEWKLLGFGKIQFQGLDKYQFQNLKKWQVEALTPNQISLLTNEQISYFISEQRKIIIIQKQSTQLVTPELAEHETTSLLEPKILSKPQFQVDSACNDVQKTPLLENNIDSNISAQTQNKKFNKEEIAKLNILEQKKAAITTGEKNLLIDTSDSMVIKNGGNLLFKHETTSLLEPEKLKYLNNASKQEEQIKRLENLKICNDELPKRKSKKVKPSSLSFT